MVSMVRPKPRAIAWLRELEPLATLAPVLVHGEVHVGQILVDGKEVDTLAGHVDLRHPLEKNLTWVKSEKEG